MLMNQPEEGTAARGSIVVPNRGGEGVIVKVREGKGVEGRRG